ncbi:MAG TPA: hypothetical protein VGN57_21645 [Pirellulaceae bacterium]|jgi:hypothetical protein|nr:hypothetical protein [Pirellulaceae bacterium]
MAKLFAIFASQAPIGVILRRGPSGWYHVIRWDVERDAYEHGAWIKGRISEEACDISPDGALLVYFICQYSRSGTSFSEAYTAVSRLPWLKALALWPNADGYGPPWGGGRFHGQRILSLRNSRSKPHPDFLPTGLHIAPSDTSEFAEAREFLLAHATRSREVEDADWCGRDYRNRLLFSRGGRLFQRVDGDDVLLADFEDLTPDPQPAPDWAALPLTPQN